MDASVVFSGETAGKRFGPADHMSVSSADKRSGLADHMNVSVQAEDDKLSSPPEYPRVTRLRHRRLIAFLQDQGFHDSYNELTDKTRAHMSLGHLCGLVELGRWGDAVEYLDRYVPPPTPTRPTPRSFHAQVLRRFLLMHHRFANAVDGMVDESVPTHYLQVKSGRAVSHAELRLRSIAFSILAVDNVRANMNWELVRYKASDVVSRLAHSAPDLRRCIELPATSIMPHHVLPIASGLWSRRRYVKKKQRGRPEAIIRALKSQRRMVSKKSSAEEAQELLADLLDETVRAGVQLAVGLSHPVQPGGNEGAQFCKFATFTEDKTSGTLANAGAQICKPMFGTFTEDKTSGTLANAGKNKHVVEAGCQTNTASQDLDGNRNSRKEPTIVELLHRDLKRQRLAGAFGEAKKSWILAGPNQSSVMHVVEAGCHTHTNPASQDLDGNGNSRVDPKVVEQMYRDLEQQRAVINWGISWSESGCVGAWCCGVSSG